MTASTKRDLELANELLETFAIFHTSAGKTSSVNGHPELVRDIAAALAQARQDGRDEIALYGSRAEIIDAEIQKAFTRGRESVLSKVPSEDEVVEWYRGRTLRGVITGVQSIHEWLLAKLNGGE